MAPSSASSSAASPATAASPVPRATREPIPGFHAIVPAGGAGTRLWPLSRAGSPKFLLDLTGSGRSLLQATVDRLAPLAGEQGVVLVTGDRHVAAARTQLPGLPAANVLADRGCQSALVHAGNGIAEGADAGQHQFVALRHPVRIGTDLGGEAHLLKGFLHAAQVGHAVVDNHDFLHR